MDVTIGKTDDGSPIDAVEEVGDVRFHEEGGPGPVARYRTREARDPAQTILGATPRNAGVAVADKAFIETLGNRVVNDVMDHAVTKLGRPDLPDFWVRHHKGEAATDLVI